MDTTVYTLEQLAEAFGLTARTARYYVERVLPGHHRSGPGRAGRYGQDTWNCFAFIRRAKEEKLTLAQFGDVLRRLDQEQIDRVAKGLEELTIVPSSSAPEPAFPSEMVRDSLRNSNYVTTPKPLSVHAMRRPGWENMHMQKTDFFEADADARPSPAWRVLYEDDELQIRHKGQATTSMPTPRPEICVTFSAVLLAINLQWVSRSLVM